ncbi:MAG: small basic family protein [Clostridiales bacterium]|nr:small basic family protein [Clostridiales bacterium]
MIIVVIGIGLGLVIGYFIPITTTGVYSIYFSVAILAALDSLFGGIRANFEDRFDSIIFISGFFGNSIIAFALAYVGDQLGVPLYYAAVFAFGTRLFNNFSIIRRYMFKRI